MTEVWNWLSGKKTYIAGGITIAFWALQHFGVSIPEVSTVSDAAMIAALMGMTVRHGVSTTAAKK